MAGKPQTVNVPEALILTLSETEPPMNPDRNKLMPWLQAIAAMLILISFFGVLFLVLLHPIAPDAQAIASPMIEVLKAIILILIGFLFGSSASSSKKDDALANAAASATPLSEPVSKQ